MTKPNRKPARTPRRALAPNADPHAVAPAPATSRAAATLSIPEQEIGWLHPLYDHEQPLPQYRHPFFIEEDRSPLPVLFDADGYPVILFEPVPMKRKRRGGWDELAQRRFIAQLARTPCVTRAAEALGLGRRSAYQLLRKPEAEQFAKAWDMALEFGLTRLSGGCLARCLDGPEEVKVMRKGRHVRTELRHNDKLAMTLLSGQNRDVFAHRRGAQRRWRQNQEFTTLDAARAAEEAARAAAAEDYQRQCEEFIAAREAARKAARIGPRIVRL